MFSLTGRRAWERH